MKTEPEAYADFVERMIAHQGILGRICSVYADRPEDRDDLRQEILLQAWRSFGGFRGQAAFSTWLYRVALNTALMYRRARGRRHETPFETGAEERWAATESQEEDEGVELLQRCIRELPRLDRALVLLSLERHGYEEIADITGLSRGNVSVRLVRIKDRLRRRLTELGLGGGTTT